MIQETLANLTYSPATQVQCRQIRPKDDYLSAKRELQETEEMITLAESGEVFPICTFEDLEPLLEEATIQGSLEPKKGLWILQSLQLVYTIMNFFQNRNKSKYLSDLAKNFHPLTSLHKEFDNCISRDGEIREDATPELKKATRAVRLAQNDLEKELGKLITNTSVKDGLQDDYFTEREGRLVIPVKTEWKNKIEGIVHDTSGSGATLFIEPTKVIPLNNQLKINRIRVEQEKIQIRRSLAKSICVNQKTIRANQKNLITFDMIHARYRLAKKMNACRFRFSLNGQVNLKQARNPELILNDQKVIPNDISWPKETRVIIISGPNTGGKTVTLKTVGLMALMARSGMLLPVAEPSEMVFFPQVYADIGDEQSIRQSLSTFSAHLVRIIKILKLAVPQSLIILDELGIATDPTQGSALAEAILMELKSKKMMTLVSTHYLSLKILAQTQKGFLNACTEFNQHSHSPTYKLVFGVPGESASLEMAQQLGLNPEIIERAQSIFQQKDTRSEKLLHSLHRQKLDLEKEQVLMEREKAKNHQLLKEQETLNETIRQHEKSFRDEKTRRLRSIIRETKSEIQNIIRKVKGSQNLEKIRQAEKNIIAFEKKNQSESLPDQSDWNLPSNKLSEGDTVIVEGYVAQGQLLENPHSRKKVRVKLGNLETLVEVDRLRGHPHLRKASPQTKPNSLKITLESAGSPKPGFSCDLRGFNLEEAKETLEAFIDKSITNKMQRVKIIHGHGMGTIKHFVRDYLKSCNIGKNIVPGSREEGGDGVTIIEF